MSGSRYQDLAVRFRIDVDVTQRILRKTRSNSRVE